MVSLFAATCRIGISDHCFTFSQKSMVHGLALPQDTRPWCLRHDRDQCCATYSSNGAVAAIAAGAGTQYSPIGAALSTRMAPALCTRPLALAPRSGWRRRMYSATGADVAYTTGIDAVCSSIGAGAEITADAGTVYLSKAVAPRSRLVLARCARPLALALRTRLSLARYALHWRWHRNHG